VGQLNLISDKNPKKRPKNQKKKQNQASKKRAKNPQNKEREKKSKKLLKINQKNPEELVMSAYSCHQYLYLGVYQSSMGMS